MKRDSPFSSPCLWKGTALQIRKIAFIGTGIMGANIAGHIMDAGYDLTVHNRTKDKAAALLARGAHWAASPAEAAADADVVFTMVGYPSDVEDVYLATDGLIRTAKKGAWLIDLTTSSPQLARDIHDAAEVEDKHAFDCPVTGGEQGAIDGTLTLIVGAAEKDVEPVLPVLEAFSSKVFCFDGPGKGQMAKLANQVALAGCMVGLAEGISFAREGGLDVAKTLEALGGYIVTPELEDVDSYIVNNSLEGRQGIMGCLELARRALES